jgi:hypothetical protein
MLVVQHVTSATDDCKPQMIIVSDHCGTGCFYTVLHAAPQQLRLHCQAVFRSNLLLLLLLLQLPVICAHVDGIMAVP